MARATDELSRVFAALADPTRRDILSRLRTQGPVTVGQLATAYAMSRPAVSQHLRVLADAGLIVQDTRAQWRECRLTDDGMDDARDWIERHRADWSQRLDNLAAHLATTPATADTEKTTAPPTNRRAR